MKSNCFYKFILVSLILIMGTSKSNSQISTKHIEAVYIKKLCQFIDWPDSSFKNDSSEFIFGFWGNKGNLPLFKKIYKDKTLKSRKVKFIYCKNFEEIKKCQLVFISSKMKKNIYFLLSIYDRDPILFVSDSEGFAGMGVHINFYTLRKKILFEINTNALKLSGLLYSPHLLRAAKIIKPKKRHS